MQKMFRLDVVAGAVAGAPSEPASRGYKSTEGPTARSKTPNNGANEISAQYLVPSSKRQSMPVLTPTN